MCSIKLAESGLIEDSLCVCKKRDMLTGKNLSESTRHPLSYCDKAIVFRTIKDEIGPWDELNSFLLNSKKAKKEYNRLKKIEHDSKLRELGI